MKLVKITFLTLLSLHWSGFAFGGTCAPTFTNSSGNTVSLQDVHGNSVTGNMSEGMVVYDYGTKGMMYCNGSILSTMAPVGKVGSNIVVAGNSVGPGAGVTKAICPAGCAFSGCFAHVTSADGQSMANDNDYSYIDSNGNVLSATSGGSTGPQYVNVQGCSWNNIDTQDTVQLMAECSSCPSSAVATSTATSTSTSTSTSLFNSLSNGRFAP